MHLLSKIVGNVVFISVENEVIKLKISDENDANRQIYSFDKGGVSSVISVTCTKDGKLLSAAFANKWVCCWNSEGLLLGSKLCNKRPTALAFANFNHSSGIILQTLLISDKSGEIWATDIPEMKNIIRLAGHTASVITDMEMAPCGSLLITADRDEKIRVSNFPQLAGIETYCLGHTNVVTSIGFIKLQNKFFLVSSGWDHALCLWDYTDGTLVSQLLLSSDSEEIVSLTKANAVRDVSSETLTVNEAGIRLEVGEAAVLINNVEVDDKLGDDDLEEVVNDGDATEEVFETGGEDLEEQDYDVDKAGHFPLKIACSENEYVAVIFKGRTVVRLYRVSANDTSSSKANTAAFELVSEVKLGEMPCDALWVHEHLLLLLPAPFYLKVFRLEGAGTDENGVQLTAVEDAAYISVFREFCHAKSCVYSQQLVHHAHATDGDKGMQKHNLDRAYWRMQAEGTAPDPKLKARNKRSKRPRFRKALEQDA